MESEKAKLFVGGISRDTGEEDLTAHFQKYGAVLFSSVARDKITRFSRGFGFVQFSESTSADLALRDSHSILGRMVDVKRAVPKNESTQSNQLPQNHSYQQRSNGYGNCSTDVVSNDCFRNKKVFVGGLPASLTEEQFKNYFERFGRIIDVVVMQDSSTNRPRGFGFITFDSEESVDKVLVSTRHDLNGRSVEVKRAVPKDEINPNGNNFTPRVGINKPLNTISQPCTYSPYALGFHFPTSFGSFPGYNSYTYGTDMYGRGYPMVGYGRGGYGINPVRGHWNGHMVIGPAMCAVPYSNACLYAAFVSDGSGACLYNRPIPLPNGNFSHFSGGNVYLPLNGAPSNDVLNLDVNGLKLNPEDGSS